MRMTLVTRLRHACEWAAPKPDLNKLMLEAAKEIERLEHECCASMEEIAALRTDLEIARLHQQNAAMTQGEEKLLNELKS